MHRSPQFFLGWLTLAATAGCFSEGMPGQTQGSTDGPTDPSSPGSFTATEAIPTTSAGPNPTVSTTDNPTSATDTSDASTDDASTGDDPSTGDDDPAFTCPTLFQFDPPPGGTMPRVAGEWHSFDLATAAAMTGPDPSGNYHATVDLPPGLHAYKIVYEQAGQTTWVYDPGQGRRKYVGDTENSAVLVPDCRAPTLEVTASTTTRPQPGAGTYAATLHYVAGIADAVADPPAYTAQLRDTLGEIRALTASEIQVDARSGDVTINLTGLVDGKYTAVVTAAAVDGYTSTPLRLVFWVEAEAFSWDGALVYMVMTDRFRDGDPSNNPGKTAMADPRGDWQGGDLQGLRGAIADGTLDALGVRAIWLTPFQTNPAPAYLASDNQHWVTGYHGYWPTRAREVDPRLGGAAALHAMVREAHAHGIRVLQDYVINHVHEDHEYVADHPEWFRTGCVCGTNGCDWTTHALECMFAPYLPDINHSIPEANAAFVDDAIFWLDEFDLDGLRVDAVKHVEEVATRNLSVAVQEGFEAAGTHYFMMGETAMGWNDCADPCNDENYDTIARYIGPFGLDGQFDFVLYHAAAYRSFAYGDNGMLHVDYWTRHGLDRWPSDAVMTPYIGSHDTPRFVSFADYRGQDPEHDRGIPGNQWSNIAVAPGDDEPYWRMRVAMAWLLGLPGAPLLYNGDEYGQWGGADPNNRLMWRAPNALDAAETETLAFIRKLGKARQTIPALQRGSYVPLYVDEDTLVYGRKGDGAAIVGITRANGAVQVEVNVSAELGLAAQTVLVDRLGGPDTVVTALGKVAVTVPGRSAVVLAP